MKILFLGAPGSGKSTQGKILANDLGFEWISSGELLRKSEDPEIIETLAKGSLIDDALTERIVTEAMEGKEKVILDGFPRTLAQCEFLVEKGIELDSIVEIVVPREELLQRIKDRERSPEDKIEIAEKRIDQYEKTRDTIVGFFEKRGMKIIQIDGVGEIDKIQLKIREAIK